jgi:hypothetical protein
MPNPVGLDVSTVDDGVNAGKVKLHSMAPLAIIFNPGVQATTAFSVQPPANSDVDLVR